MNLLQRRPRSHRLQHRFQPDDQCVEADVEGAIGPGLRPRRARSGVGGHLRGQRREQLGELTRVEYLVRRGGVERSAEDERFDGDDRGQNRRRGPARSIRG